MKRIFLLILFFLALNIFAQKGKYVEVEMITHPVQMGETIRTISQKYLVDPGEIYQFNKYAVNGIKPGMTLLIPIPVKDPIVIAEKKDKPKKIELPKTENTTDSKPIAVKTNSKPVVIDNSKQVDHIIEAKETLYSLSKKYSISADELKLANPSIETSGLQIGMTIKIPSTRELADVESSIGSTKAPIIDLKPKAPILQTTTKHTVVAKETLYSLSRKYEIALDDILKQNPELNVSGLKIGMVLNISK